MKQFISFIRKEFFHVFRDPKTLLMLFGMPITLIVLFGFALTNEIKDAKIVVCDFAKDQASQCIITELAAGGNFQIAQAAFNAGQIDSAFKAGNIKLAIIFPTKLYQNLLQQHHAQVQVIADASDPNTATTLTNYVNATVINYQQSLQQGSAAPMQIITETRMLYNPGLQSATNFVPGVMALILLLVCVLMTSVSIVREKERGTMEVLLVSPFSPLMVILAKATPYFLLSLINLCVILFLSVFLLQMPFKGSVILLFAESGLFIFTALSLGLLISNSTNSQQTAMLISLMGMLIPTLLFTGFLFPLENMPKPLQVIANIVPSKWYYNIVKAIMVKGLGFSAIWKETAILIGMTVILLLISLKKFKIRLE